MLNKSGQKIFEIILGTSLVLLTLWANFQTSKIVSLEQGPNISISDIILVYVDETNTPVRTTSWKNGTQKEERGAIEKNTSVFLALKFNNYARHPGYVELQKGPIPNMESNSVLEMVSPNTETGELFVIPLLQPPTPTFDEVKGVNVLTSPAVISNLEYKFRYYDQMKQATSDVDVIVRCQWNFYPVVGGRPAAHIVCKPIGVME